MKKIYAKAMNLYAGMDKKGRMVGMIDLDRITTTRKMLKVMCDGKEVGFIDCNSLLLEVRNDDEHS